MGARAGAREPGGSSRLRRASAGAVWRVERVPRARRRRSCRPGRLRANQGASARTRQTDESWSDYGSRLGKETSAVPLSGDGVGILAGEDHRAGGKFTCHSGSHQYIHSSCHCGTGSPTRRVQHNPYAVIASVSVCARICISLSLSPA